VRRATKETAAGRRYLDLQRQARRTGRRTDELIQLYALECFLDRLAHSDFSEQFVLKGGVLLAALDARRPTRDIDFAARAVDNSVEQVSAVVRRIAGISLDDGVEFDSDNATAEVVREQDDYSGIRVTLRGTLSRTVIRFRRLHELRYWADCRTAGACAIHALRAGRGHPARTACESVEIVALRRPKKF